MRSAFFTAMFAAAAFVALLPVAAALAQEVDDASERANEAINQACLNTGACEMPRPGAPVMVPVYFAAIAFSVSTGNSGSAHGQPSQAAAEQTAMRNCVGQDCKLVIWGRNDCIALAVGGGNASGWAPSNTREGAQAAALSGCSKYASNCVTRSAPCAGDDVRFGSPLPFPQSGPNPAGPMDRALVGSWHLAINPGYWDWRIAPNGTFTIFSHAMDNEPSTAGTFTADGKTWSMHGLNNGITDGGPYHIDAQGNFIATGKLGTGTWVRAGS
jgi:hypothetical protein